MFVDPPIAAEVKMFADEVDAMISEVVGRTAVTLVADRSVCRQFECNLGMSPTLSRVSVP